MSELLIARCESDKRTYSGEASKLSDPLTGFDAGHSAVSIAGSKRSTSMFPLARSPPIQLTSAEASASIASPVNLRLRSSAERPSLEKSLCTVIA